MGSLDNINGKPKTATTTTTTTKWINELLKDSIIYIYIYIYIYIFNRYIKIYCPRSPSSKCISKFEIILVKIFSLKQKNKSNTSTCYRKNQISSLQENSPLQENSSFRQGITMRKCKTKSIQPGVVACTCNPATLEAEFRNGVCLTPVGGNIPAIGGWIVRPPLIQN